MPTNEVKAGIARIITGPSGDPSLLLSDVADALPSSCLQTSNASSVAKRVLGWRMKIFVLEKLEGKQIFYKTSGGNIYFVVIEEQHSIIAVAWYSSYLPILYSFGL